MIITKTVPDNQFLALMVAKYDEDIFRKIPESGIYNLYMETKYGNHVAPMGSVSKIIKDFVCYLVASRANR